MADDGMPELVPDLEEIVRDARALREAAYDLCAQIADLNNLMADIVGAPQDVEDVSDILILSPDDLEIQRERCSRLADEANAILKDAEEGFVRTWNQRDRVAFDLFTRVQSLREELEATDAQVTAALEILERSESEGWIKEGLGRAKQMLKGTILPTLRRLLGRLWALLKHLVYPKEWKLKGELGNTVWGLTKVGVEITFGKP